MRELERALTEAGIAWKKNCPLAPLGSFRIGGNAELALFPDSREKCLAALSLIRKEKISLTVIGNGSNVVFPDAGLSGAVLFTGGCQAIRMEGETVEADAGISLSRLALAARDAGLSGAEFLYGIPGTLGGAVFMNAGAYGGCIDQICLSSDFYDGNTGTVRRLSGAEQAFAVRSSVYQGHPEDVILGATLRLSSGVPEQIAARMSEFLARRKQTQPLEFPSAGSVFKRPEGHYAGKLIEDCGLKGARIGGAEVSQKHAGFIINRGGASAADVRALIAQIRQTVLEKTGVLLECEIRFPGEHREE